MNKQLIKQAFQLGYAYGAGVFEKKASLGSVALGTGLHTIPGLVAAYGSDTVNKDPEKYWQRGKKYALGGLAAQLAGVPLFFAGHPVLKGIGALTSLAGGLGTMYGTNAAIAGAIAKHRKKKLALSEGK